MDFFTVHGDLVGGGDAEAHLVAFDGDYGNADRAADDNSFTDLAREYEHAILPAKKSEACAGRTCHQEPDGVASSPGIVGQPRKRVLSERGEPVTGWQARVEGKGGGGVEKCAR